MPCESPASIDRAAYAEDGVLVLPAFFNSADTAGLKQAWRDVKAGMAAEGLERNARFVIGVLPGVLGRLYRHPQLVELATSILGRDVALYMNRILVKDEHWGGPVAIHQDMPYFHGGQQKLSIFVPLSPTQADGGNGGLKFVAGSHKYGSLERGTVDRSCFRFMPDIAPSLETGDIVMMDFLTWHYSETPVVQDERPLMQIVYQPSSDGSFGGTKIGVPEPTLVHGDWQTSHFTEWSRGVTPDAR
jgi:hypothetical protein